MNRKTIRDYLLHTVAGAGALTLTACNGIFDGIYDDPGDITLARQQLVIDATSWENWYYVDLPTLYRLRQTGDSAALQKAQTEFEAYPIPMTPTGDEDATEEGHAAATQGEKPGQYMYWFDVWGEGYRNSRFTSYTPTEAQTAPGSWTFAVHRNNVRTNGAEVLETSFTSIDRLPETSDYFRDMTFTRDEWSENEVWDSQEKMLRSYVPSQGIAVNKVLSSWLTMEIPPMPPAYTLNSRVFVLRLKDGTYAALQLANYLSPNGTKCYLTINYKYPY